MQRHTNCQGLAEPEPPKAPDCICRLEVPTHVYLSLLLRIRQLCGMYIIANFNLSSNTEIVSTLSDSVRNS